MQNVVMHNRITQNNTYDGCYSVQAIDCYSSFVQRHWERVTEEKKSALFGKIKMAVSQHQLALDPKFEYKKCRNSYEESNGANYFMIGFLLAKTLQQTM